MTMSSTIWAEASGQFKVGTDPAINRPIFGTMEITGTGKAAHLEDKVPAASIKLMALYLDRMLFEQINQSFSIEARESMLSTRSFAAASLSVN